MTGVGRPRPPRLAGRLEQAIGALIPPDRCRSTPPVTLPVAALPSVRPPTAAGFVLDIARMDASGRFTCAALLRELGWLPGRPVALTTLPDAVVVSADDRQAATTVGKRGELALPAASRASTGLHHDARIVLVAVPARDLLIVHPPTLLAGLLAAHYAAAGGSRP
jgi:hypothetical protein